MRTYDELTRDLEYGDEPEQVRAVRQLGRLDDPRVWRLLVTLLDHPSPRVHREAITVLGRGGPPADAALAPTLRDENSKVRNRAAEALARSAEVLAAARIDDPALIGELASVLEIRDLEDEALGGIADALARVGTPAVPFLLQLFRSPNYRIRANAVETMIRMADQNPNPALVAAIPLLRYRLRPWVPEDADTVGRIHVALDKIQALSFAGTDLPLPATAPTVELGDLPIPFTAENTAGE
jgi:HEAT repeat protein